jgi:enoyl-CoA hydratase/carnithine racemase
MHSEEMGFVDYLLCGPSLESFSLQMAEEIAANAPLALRGTKRVLNLLLQSSSLEHDSRMEAESIIEAASLGEDEKEGQRAFLDKRKPRFRGQ